MSQKITVQDGSLTFDALTGLISLTSGVASATAAGSAINLTSSPGGATSGFGGAIDITSGDSGPGVDDAGGDITITAGTTTATTGAGGNIFLQAGGGSDSAGSTGFGGQVQITGGPFIGDGDGPPGDVVITAGANTAANASSADVSITGGGTTTGVGGDVNIRGGNSSLASGVGGIGALRGGFGGTNGTGGAVQITGGTAGGSAGGGAVAITSGDGTSTGNAGALDITGGIGGNIGTGGTINITSGAGGATSGDGGDITFTVGTGTGGGTDGIIQVTGTIEASDAAGWTLLDEAATGTNPTVIPNKTDPDTGIGSQSADRLSLIAGGVEAINLTEASSHVIATYEAEASITASTTQTQGQQPLTSSYNFVDTVANANDVVTMPSASIGMFVHVCNNGANILQIFPAAFDNLGAGTDTSITLAAGESQTWMARNNSNWITLAISSSGGGGDVTKVGTPVDNEIGVWTGDGTLEGDTNLTWDGTNLTLSGTTHLVLPATSDAVTPVLAFGDGDSGFYEQLDDQIVVSIAGTARFHWISNQFTTFSASAGPVMLDIDASATVPSFSPANNDLDTGIGTSGLDALSLIAGGVEANRITAAIVQTTDATVTEIIGISVASGEGFGFELHVIGTEDSTGDSVFERVFGAIRNQGGTTALIGSIVTDRTDDAGASTWTITVAADDTADELTVDVTGEAAHTIDWKIRVVLLQI